MNEVIILSKSELKKELIDALTEFDKIKKASEPTKLFFINQVATRLGRHHSTIKTLVEKGVIRSTKDGMIPEDAIQDYLKTY